MPATVRSNGTADPIDPPHETAQEWLTAVWLTQSAYPSAPSTGTSYVYGHACHYHVCSFTALRNVRVGDPMTVTVPSRKLTYRVCAIGRSPKSGNLQVPRCANGLPDLVLVTCEYEQGDTSTSNLVVAANLTQR
jgi:sortase (surface protein transpeptidase)